MITLTGKTACQGIAFGKAFIYKHEANPIQRRHIEDTEHEKKRFEDAKGKAIEELEALYQKALTEVGEENAVIFQIHQMMLDDIDYVESIHGIIMNQKLNAEAAVAIASENFFQMFAAMEDAYMRERAADIKDISERVLKILQNQTSDSLSAGEKVILLADNLAPSETVQMDKSKILGFATQNGSPNSHTSILARTMNIPTVIGVENLLNPRYDGADIIIDANQGKIYIEPDTETVCKLKQIKEQEDQQHALLKTLKDKKSISLDHVEMNLYANIGNLSDLDTVITSGAQGIGLFRSEFIYLENKDFPSENLQFSIYRDVLQKMSGKKVIIRTLDIGADKQVDYFNMPPEENPAMGVRAIRICFERPEVFKTQLRALYRASVFGPLGIMFPMITSVEEVHRIKKIINEVKAGLDADGLPYAKDIELGIMIETPAAVIISDLLAQEVDFFSIGTNDLIQYTLACDRQNDHLASLCDPHSKAVLRMIKTAVDNAHAAGIWIGICGELAADTALTRLFLSMGVDELSMSPGSILGIRKIIRETDTERVREEEFKKYL